jgi:hypothetical protein
MIVRTNQANRSMRAADAVLTELITKDRNVIAYQVAEVYAWRGETDKAFEWLEISLEMLTKVGLPPSTGVAVDISSVTSQNLSHSH